MSERATLPARTGRAFRLAQAEAIKIINTHGTQVVDTWALSADVAGEHLSMSHTRTSLGRLRPTEGDALLSNRRRPLLVLEEDTSPGVHDTLIPACDPERYRLLGAAPGHASCAENFRMAVGRERAVPDPLNLFMNVAWNSAGQLEFRPPVARPGDHVTLRAAADVLVVLSACPMDLNPVNAQHPREVEVELLVARSG
jgi:uncharacterized protein YcgI (DUF1989 family)